MAVKRSSKEVKTAKTAAGAGTAADRAGVRYGKEQILNSSRYRGQRDLVNALLEKGKQYSLEEVDGQLEEYLKGRVM